MQCKRRNVDQIRRGFSLVELLVVIAVMAVLIALIVPATMGILRNGRIAATQATIKQVSSALNSRIEAWRRSKNTNDAHLSSMTLQVGTCSDATLTKILQRKESFRRYFPQTWAEVQSAWGLEYMGNSLASSVPGPSQPPANVTTAERVESAEVLYWLLTDGIVPGNSQVEAMTFTSANSRDTDGNGFLEIVDAWGNPIRFWRWPTRLIRPDGIPDSSTSIPAISTTNWDSIRSQNNSLPTSAQAGNSQQLRTDPDDPMGIAPPKAFPPPPPGQACYTFTAYETAYHTLATYCAPLIASAGEDGEFGINPPRNASTSSRGYWAMPDGNYGLMLDNITNSNLKSGGK
jgi:prepilin-type N-terminal cleavage/methylation domain-containing protein